MQHRPDAPVVVLSPHLDDAVLSAWSVLRAPGEVVVVNVFAGLPEAGGPTRCDRLVGATDSRELMRTRIAEDRRALAEAGRRPVNLDFLDEQYRSADPAPGVLAAWLAERVPAAAALHAPAAIRGHRDHELVRRLALELGRAHGIPVVLYADLPYAVHYGWPAWVTGDEPLPGLDPEVDWELALGSAPLNGEALTARAERLEPTEAAAKLRALGCYETQFALLNRGPLGLLDHPRVLPFEVRWQVDTTGTRAPVS